MGWRKDGGPDGGECCKDGGPGEGKCCKDGGTGGGGSLPDCAAPSGDFSGKAGGGVGRGRVGDHAHPCAVSPKKAIRGLFTLVSWLLSRKIDPPPQHSPGGIPRRPALGCGSCPKVGVVAGPRLRQLPERGGCSWPLIAAVFVN